MRKRRVKLIWGASQVIRGRWHCGLFGYYERVPGDVHSGLAISVRGVLGWGGVLAAILYVAGAAALHSVWRRNPYSQLTLADALLYPVRAAHVAEKKGRAFIAEGSAMFRAGKYADAANLLRLGLARVPGELEARVQLAHFYVMANQRPLATRVLEEGLAEAYPGRSYLEPLFNAYEEAEHHAGSMEISRRYLPQLAAQPSHPDRRWLEGRAFAALLAAGKPAEALELTAAMLPGGTAQEHGVLALLALGRASDALASLDEWRRAPAADQLAILRLRARALREAGRVAEMEQALQELAMLLPAEPAPLVYGVVQRSLAGAHDMAAAALADYVFRFGGSLENLTLVAEALGELRDVALLKQCAAAAQERGYALHRFHALLAQAHVAQGEWPQARERLDQFARGNADVAPAARAWREWMQRLVDAAASPANSAQLSLLEFLRSRAWPMRMIRVTIETLRRAGREQTASEAITIGLRAFPANAWLQSTAGELKSRMAATPSRARDAAPEPSLGEDTFFAQLEQIVEAGQWESAEQLIRQARAARPAPAWIERRDAELWFVQSQCRQARGDMTGLATAARMYLGGKEENAKRLLDLARGFHERDDRAAAVVVTKEVLRRFPTFAAAQQQLAAWEPKPGEGRVP